MKEVKIALYEYEHVGGDTPHIALGTTLYQSAVIEVETGTLLWYSDYTPHRWQACDWADEYLRQVKEFGGDY